MWSSEIDTLTREFPAQELNIPKVIENAVVSVLKANPGLGNEALSKAVVSQSRAILLSRMASIRQDIISHEEKSPVSQVKAPAGTIPVVVKTTGECIGFAPLSLESAPRVAEAALAAFLIHREIEKPVLSQVSLDRQEAIVTFYQKEFGSICASWVHAYLPALREARSMRLNREGVSDHPSVTEQLRSILAWPQLATRVLEQTRAELETWPIRVHLPPWVDEDLTVMLLIKSCFGKTGGGHGKERVFTFQTIETLLREPAKLADELERDLPFDSVEDCSEQPVEIDQDFYLLRAEQQPTPDMCAVLAVETRRNWLEKFAMMRSERWQYPESDDLKRMFKQLRDTLKTRFNVIRDADSADIALSVEGDQIRVAILKR